MGVTWYQRISPVLIYLKTHQSTIVHISLFYYLMSRNCFWRKLWRDGCGKKDVVYQSFETKNSFWASRIKPKVTWNQSFFSFCLFCEDTFFTLPNHEDGRSRFPWFVLCSTSAHATKCYKTGENRLWKWKLEAVLYKKHNIPEICIL